MTSARVETSGAPSETASSHAAPSSPSFGERYRVDREIGAGAMAIVYRGHDVKHDREVAIKELRPEFADGLARDRFDREIKILGGLQHPNIVPMYDSGEVDGRHYFVMPYVDGSTLRARLERDGRLSAGDVLHVMREIADALAYAHGEGVVHRDIKPENIMLIGERAVLADFGIAHAVHGARVRLGSRFDTLTDEWTWLGTPAYMAPEQAGGGATLDHRADLYSLGVVAYEMLAGQPPFTAPSPQQVIAAHLAASPPSLASVAPDVPPRLAALVMQCLEKAPDHRPATAGDIIRHIEALAAPASGAASAPLTNPRPSPARRPARAGRLLTLGAALAVGGALLARAGLSPATRGAGPTVSPVLPTTVHVGVLPFPAPSRMDDQRAQLIQYLLVSELARYRGLGLMDPASLNSRLRATASGGTRDPSRELGKWGLQYVVRLTATSTAKGYEVGFILSDAAGEIVRTGALADTASGDLQAEIRRAGGELAAALESRTGGLARRLDVAPFVTGQERAAAVTAFLQGIDYAYRGLPGGGQYFRRAISLSPDFIAPRVFLVSGLALDGDTLAAREHVQHLHTLKASGTPFEQALIDWSDALVTGDLKARIRHVQVALQYSPGNNILLYDLAASLWMDGRPDEAIAPAREALQSGWRFSPLYTLWGVVSIETDRLAGLRDTLAGSLQYTPVDPYIPGLLEALAIVEGDSGAAHRFHASFLDQLGKGREVEGYAEMGVIYRALAGRARRRHELANEVALLTKALDAQPRLHIARLELARAQLDGGRPRDAEATYRLVADSLLRDAALLLLAGEVGERLGSRNDAIRHYARYLDVAPHGADTATVRKRLRALGGS